MQAQGGNCVNVLPQAQQPGRPVGLASLVTEALDELVSAPEEPAACLVAGVFVMLDEWVMVAVELSRLLGMNEDLIQCNEFCRRWREFLT